MTVLLLRGERGKESATKDGTEYSQRSPVLVLSAAKTLLSVANSTFLVPCRCVSKEEKRTLPTYCCRLRITRRSTGVTKELMKKKPNLP